VSKGQRIRSYDYVNHPYDSVRRALRADTVVVFQAATKAAASRANSLASELKVDLAGIKIGADIAIAVTSVRDVPGTATSGQSTIIDLEWEAATRPHLFPFMKGQLTLYPLTPTETQLDFSGTYEPPLGVLGSAMNTVIGHRLAESSVHRFVADVAQYLRATLQ
jgi:hypothetical protein